MKQSTNFLKLKANHYAKIVIESIGKKIKQTSLKNLNTSRFPIWIIIGVGIAMCTSCKTDLSKVLAVASSDSIRIFSPDTTLVNIFNGAQKTEPEHVPEIRGKYLLSQRLLFRVGN